MDRMVARLNIEHFRKQLATETDPVKRETIATLLAEEETKLATLDAATPGAGSHKTTP